MAKNPITWVEELDDGVKKTTAPINQLTFKDIKWNLPKFKSFAKSWAVNKSDIDELRATWSLSTSLTNQFNKYKMSDVNDNITVNVDKDTEFPTVKTEDTATGTTGTDTWITSTWIPVLDTSLSKIKKERDETIKKTKKDFIEWKAEFEKNKGYYTNYDDVSNKYTWVTDDLVNSMDDSWSIPEEKYQEIATKYGLTVDQVKYPKSILKGWELTEEGKKELWLSPFEDQVDTLKTNLQRRKDDIKTSLEDTTRGINQQIEDIWTQLARNVGWTEAMWAWSGALRWTWYLQWIQNIKDDANKTISRLNALAKRVQWASEETLKRATEDYNKALANAQDTLTKQTDSLKQNWILALTEAQTTYGLWSEKLTEVLDDINNTYWIKSNEAVSAYLKNVSSMNQIASDNISLLEEKATYEDNLKNKRFNEYLTNDWANLQNSTYSSIMNEVTSWSLTPDKAIELKNIMKNSIAGILWDAVNITDLNQIETLLSEWKTPLEVVATMRADEKFQDNVSAWNYDIKEVWDVTYKLNKDTWKYEVLTGWSTVMDQYRVTQDYGATSPNGIDNVLLANGETGTPGIDYAMPKDTDVTSFVDGTVDFVGPKWDYWTQVVVVDKNGNKHMYSHLNAWSVKKWDPITVWQIIGKSWNTGFSTGPHLDYRVRGWNWSWLDPKAFIPSEETIEKWVKYDQNKISEYKDYMETWSLPTGMKFWTDAYNNFVQEANEWYRDVSEKILKQKWFNLVDYETYKDISNDDRKKLAEEIKSFWAFEQSMDKLITYAEKYWNKTLPWTTKKLIEQETQNAFLQAKELFNLWVLNGPDIDILAKVIPDITSNGITQLFKWAITDEVKLMEWAKKSISDNVKASFNAKWITPIGEKSDSDEFDNFYDWWELSEWDEFDKYF